MENVYTLVRAPSDFVTYASVFVDVLKVLTVHDDFCVSVVSNDSAGVRHLANFVDPCSVLVKISSNGFLRDLAEAWLAGECHWIAVAIGERLLECYRKYRENASLSEGKYSFELSLRDAPVLDFAFDDTSLERVGMRPIRIFQDGNIRKNWHFSSTNPTLVQNVINALSVSYSTRKVSACALVPIAKNFKFTILTLDSPPLNPTSFSVSEVCISPDYAMYPRPNAKIASSDAIIAGLRRLSTETTLCCIRRDVMWNSQNPEELADASQSISFFSDSRGLFLSVSIDKCTASEARAFLLQRLKSIASRYDGEWARAQL